jgi:hypothetical protein
LATDLVATAHDGIAQVLFDFGVSRDRHSSEPTLATRRHARHASPCVNDEGRSAMRRISTLTDPSIEGKCRPFVRTYE